MGVSSQSGIYIFKNIYKLPISLLQVLSALQRRKSVTTWPQVAWVVQSPWRPASFSVESTAVPLAFQIQTDQRHHRQASARNGPEARVRGESKTTIAKQAQSQNTKVPHHHLPHNTFIHQNMPAEVLHTNILVEEIVTVIQRKITNIHHLPPLPTMGDRQAKTRR